MSITAPVFTLAYTQNKAQSISKNQGGVILIGLLVMGVEVQPNTDMCVQNKVRFEFR
jgi:hypothetical protein